MIAYSVWRLRAIVVQRGFVVRCEFVDHPVAKRQGPGLNALGAGMPVQFPQVVSDAAGADQQDAMFAQAGQRVANTGLQGGAATGGQ
ncbi:hypothetical protein D3C81_1322970 [compost metagenome]